MIDAEKPGQSVRSGPGNAPATPPRLPVVLIIGPEETLRGRLCALLKDLPVEVEEIGLEAVSEDFWSLHSQEPCPSMVVLDVGGDLGSGARTLRQFKECGNSTPVVVLTRDASRDFAEKILSQGVVYYLTHDFLPNEFLDVAKNLLKL